MQLGSPSWAPGTPGSSPRTRTSACGTAAARKTSGARFSCSACSRSSVGASILRDTRFGLPFATGGSYANVSGELNGGFLGGTGNYRKVDLEGKWYAPLGIARRRRPARRRRGAVRARPDRPRRGSFSATRARSSPSCTRSAGCSTAFRCAATTSSRSRRTGSIPTASSNSASAGRVREVVRRVHRRGGRPHQPVAVRRRVLRCGQRVSHRAPVGPDPALPRARASARRWCRRWARSESTWATGSTRWMPRAVRPRAGNCTSSWAISSKCTHLSSGAEHEAVVRRGKLGRYPRALSLSPPPWRPSRAVGRQDRLRQYAGDPQADPGIRRGRVDVLEGARDLPRRGAEAAGESGLGRLGLRAAVRDAEPDAARGQAKGPRGPAAEAGAADPGAAAACLGTGSGSCSIRSRPR